MGVSALSVANVGPGYGRVSIKSWRSIQSSAVMGRSLSELVVSFPVPPLSRIPLTQVGANSVACVRVAQLEMGQREDLDVIALLELGIRDW